MRDVLVGALASELKVDVVETTPPRARARARRPGGRRGHRPRGRPWAATAPSTRSSTACSSRARRRTCRCWPSSPAGPPTSSRARWAAPGTRWRPPRRSSPRSRAGRTRLVSLGTASASGTDDAGRRRLDRPALVRLRRRPRLRRRGHRPGRGPAGRGTAVHRRALRPRGGHRVPARPRTAASGDDAAACPASRRSRTCSSAWSPT